jgi:hypothetical protein
MRTGKFGSPFFFDRCFGLPPVDYLSSVGSSREVRTNLKIFTVMLICKIFMFFADSRRCDERLKIHSKPISVSIVTLDTVTMQVVVRSRKTAFCSFL